MCIAFSRSVTADSVRGKGSALKKFRTENVRRLAATRSFPRLLRGAMILSFLVLPLPVLAQETIPARSVVDLIVERALDNNPALAAQRQKILALRERPSGASALPDPTADLRFMMLPVEGGLNANDALTQGVSLGVTQRFPFPGKLKLRKRKAERQVRVAEVQLQSLESRLRGQVVTAVYRIALYQGLLDVNRKTQEALAAAAKGAAAVYASGSGSQADVLLAQAALTKSKVAEKDLEKQFVVARAGLDDLLGEPADPSLIEEVTLPEPGPEPELAELIDTFSDTAPAVLEARAEETVHAEQVAIARKNFKPDFTVSARYRHNDMTMGGHDFLTAAVGITLPFFHRGGRYHPALREAMHMLDSARERTRNSLNETRYQLVDAYQSSVLDRETYVLYKDGLLIQAKKAYESARSSYRVGTADFMTLLRSLTNYYSYESQALKSKADYQVSRARIEAVIGHPLGVEKETVR